MSEKQKDSPNINKNVHPPIVAMIFIIVGLLLGRFIPFLANMPPIMKNIGLALTFVGFLFGVGAFLEFRKARTTLDPHGSAKTLVKSGIYRFTRNPMYLGLLLLLAGWALYLANILAFLFLPAFILYMNRFQIKPEERALMDRFGQKYLEYASRVNRWI